MRQTATALDLYRAWGNPRRWGSFREGQRGRRPCWDKVFHSERRRWGQKFEDPGLFSFPPSPQTLVCAKLRTRNWGSDVNPSYYYTYWPKWIRDQRQVKLKCVLTCGLHYFRVLKSMFWFFSWEVIRRAAEKYLTVSHTKIAQQRYPLGWPPNHKWRVINNTWHLSESVWMWVNY